MIIWGFRTIKKDRGTVGTFQCANCNNVSPWKLLQTTRFFTIFFIPIIPYSFKYYVVCPICGDGKEISKLEFKNRIEQNKNLQI